MEFVIRAQIRDPKVVDALEVAKRHRQMPCLIENALARYIRTPEGRKTLALISGEAIEANLDDKGSVTAKPRKPRVKKGPSMACKPGPAAQAVAPSPATNSTSAGPAVTPATGGTSAPRSLDNFLFSK